MGSLIAVVTSLLPETKDIMLIMKFAGLVLAYLLLVGCTLRTPESATETDISVVELPNYLEQAASLTAERRYAEAVSQLEKAAAVNQNDLSPRIEIGQIYLTQHRWDLAERIFRQVLEQDPVNRAAIVGLAETMLGRQEPVEATFFWRQAIALDQGQADGWAGLGRASLTIWNYCTVPRMVGLTCMMSP